jgi:hypothetical protein
MRELTDHQGRVWNAVVASHGTSSGYLNPKVHRPVVQFSCATQALPRRYAPLPGKAESLEDLDDLGLSALFRRSKVY